MANPLDAYVTSRPGSFPRDFKVPPVPSLKTSMAGKSPADGQASHDAQMEQWRKNLENSIAERMREPAAATTTTTVAATPASSIDQLQLSQIQSDLAEHISSDVVHGTQSPVVGQTDVETLDGKDIGTTAPGVGMFKVGMSSNIIGASDIVSIPAGFNAIIAGGLAINGSLTIDGTLLLLSPKVTPLVGSVILGIGVSSGTISGLSLPFVPSAVIPIVSKPSGGLNIFANPIEKSLSAAGFSFDLSGTTDSTSYRLVFLFLP